MIYYTDSCLASPGTSTLLICFEDAISSNSRKSLYCYNFFNEILSFLQIFTYHGYLYIIHLI